nr:SDR family NAD(P)-dependent oxidoreductase [uncultured Methanoregula sp.]
MFEDLKGKNVLVTGASSGIGECTVQLFSRYGSRVGIHYHSNKISAENISRTIRSRGNDAFTLEANLMDPEEASALIHTFIDSAGGIDILVNNAGGPVGNQDFLEMDVSSWNQTLALNLVSPFFLAREAFSFMKSHGGGKIINISSISAKYGGSSKSIHYGAAKSGLEAVTKTLAREGAPHHILVNAIRPGVIDTPAHQKMGRKNLDDRIKHIPLQQAGKPRDIAQLCVFLGSSCGDYITGQVYDVAGGD